MRVVLRRELQVETHARKGDQHEPKILVSDNIAFAIGLHVVGICFRHEDCLYLKWSMFTIETSYQ